MSDRFFQGWSWTNFLSNMPPFPAMLESRRARSYPSMRPGGNKGRFVRSGSLSPDSAKTYEYL